MGIKLGMDIRTSLSQTLTPQQIQYLKLLQLPVMQFEQYLQREIESNPMVDEELPDHVSDSEYQSFNSASSPITKELQEADPVYKERVGIEDQGDPFDFYKMIWQDDSTYKPVSYSNSDSDDSEPFQIKQQESLSEELLWQFDLLDLAREEMLLGIQLIGNIDDDGYLRRNLDEIIDETNSQIAEHNFKQQQKYYEKSVNNNNSDSTVNPALRFALDDAAVRQLDRANILKEGKMDFSDGQVTGKLTLPAMDSSIDLIKPVNIEMAEGVLNEIRHLEPPGIGSRNIQECLLVQLEMKMAPTPEEQLATDILKSAYDAFIKKHYGIITKQFGISEEILREVIEVIKSLNPKPGGGDFYEQTNSVIPDFVITQEEESDELTITVNDGHTPTLKLNRAYESMKRETKFKAFNKDTKNWMRSKHEDAKFLIQAIRQRKNTMLKVMTAITQRQKDFFIDGENAIRPMIYKDISEDTGLDISTVCRIVNGKYTQTDFGTYELKYFFSESLPSNDGEEISTKVIKQALKEIIEMESKSKPYSDDKLSAMLDEKGYQVARRTVAKYREQLKIPVARLRKEI